MIDYLPPDFFTNTRYWDCIVDDDLPVFIPVPVSLGAVPNWRFGSFHGDRLFGRGYYHTARALPLPIPLTIPTTTPPLLTPTHIGDAVVGFKFVKAFEDQDFAGTITRCNSDDDLYHAAYDDGGVEDFSPDELAMLTLNPPLPSQLPLSQQPPHENHLNRNTKHHGDLTSRGTMHF